MTVTRPLAPMASPFMDRPAPNFSWGMLRRHVGRGAKRDTDR